MSLVQLTDGREREEDGGEAKSYDYEKAWPSINHSRLSDRDTHFLMDQMKMFTDSKASKAII